MSEKRFVITIGRKYGAGGGEVGRMLAEQLGMPFYDKKILQMVSDESGIKESYFHMADEKPGDNIIYRLAKSITPKLKKPSIGSDLLSDDNLFLFQSELLQKLADEHNCIIAGRCADHVLQGRVELVKIFITAGEEKRIDNMATRLSIPKDESKKNMKKIDKQRSEYYTYYTGKDWSSADNYDLSINTQVVGVEKSVEIIKEYLKTRELL